MKKKNKAAEELRAQQLRHTEILSTVLDCVLGAVPYAHTALLLVDMDDGTPALPFFAVKKRGAVVSKTDLERVTKKLEDCLQQLKKETGAPDGQH